MKKYLDLSTVVIIIITVLLFAVSLFVKGFTHDLLLEAGILLVSVKLIMMAYKTHLYYSSIDSELREIKELLNRS